jgi:hypothetical protein
MENINTTSGTSPSIPVTQGVRVAAISVKNLWVREVYVLASDGLMFLHIGHPQKLHSANHGSMVETQWIVEAQKGASGKPIDSGYILEAHKYGSGDDGSPMLCQFMCTKQGRHAHVDFCLDPQNHTSPACEHIPSRMHPEPDRPKDWISHATYWERTGKLEFLLHNIILSPDYDSIVTGFEGDRSHKV